MDSNAFLRRICRDSTGSVAVEFSLLALPFAALILAAIQVMIVMLTQQLLETAAEAIGRKILTGYVQKQALTSTQFVTMACGVLPTTLNCNRLILDVQVASSFSNAVTSKPNLQTFTNPTTTTVLTFNPGVAGQIVVLRVLYALPIVTIPGLNLQISPYGLNFPMATSVFKNEIYQ